MSPRDVADILDTAKRAFAHNDWATAFSSFRAAGQMGGLSADQWYSLAESAWWLGEIDAALDAWKRAHDLYVASEDLSRAAMSAMFLACHSLERGDTSVGSGWMQRTRRLLDNAPEGPAHGYPLYFRIFAAMSVGDLDEAMSWADEVGRIGRRFDDPSLVALSLIGRGRALVKRGSVADGMALLDAAMLDALSGRLHPVWTGAVYCHLMDACYELDELRRAGEWTHAASRWCDGIPDAGLYRGICRVHRAQILHTRGSWQEAEREATQACADMAHVHIGTIAEGHYEIGEIRRLRGDLVGAEDAFRRAHELGRDPQPGLALVRLAQGHADTAAASIRTALAVLVPPLPRARLCVAQVEIALAAGDLETARAACTELEQTAATYESSGLAAAVQQARGALLLREGAAPEAVTMLRAACRRWQDLDATHHAANTRLLLAEAYRSLGDEDAAALELNAADAVFAQLGAEPGRRRVASLRGPRALPGGMTAREIEVLRLVATGCSNRDVAAMLFISERTVHRHLSNIYTKLGISSRSAATAYAFEHGIATGNG
ncbi:LuxR C-terminal-related transcriptional regulator [Pseudonocardia charpentierae]|uniref:LuxR C-terminal-related transcriptional regulator n=1 Tax=Pseudonocardia charpentierae TaxID=3075545 RepID=A0ABU2NGI8_9PSEU|nr:LuxR C-terminal-related transcriptional regulator [Pseudonocardia sp. DSM 45834]MDT0353066.1 LuxR C-terminal-related transcriptional regulator [Pseudonocardia sp. DSM 45834]